MTVQPIEHPAAGSLPDKIQYAKALASAQLIPVAFRNKPADVLVAIEYGDALGLRPVVAMAEINVINGTPSLSAALMASLARAAGHKVRVTGDARSARCEVIRADDPDFSHVAVWDEAKAKAAGLWGKGHWSKDAATMLKWRAISEAVRFACPEVLAGIRYTPEEVAEFTPAPKTDAPAPATSIREAMKAERVDADTGEVYDAEVVEP